MTTYALLYLGPLAIAWQFGAPKWALILVAGIEIQIFTMNYFAARTARYAERRIDGIHESLRDARGEIRGLRGASRPY